MGRGVGMLIGPLTYIQFRDLHFLELYLHLYMLTWCNA